MTATDRPRIGIDLGGTKIEGVLLDEEGKLLRSLRLATPRHDYEATLEAIAGVVEQLERDLGGPLSVGVGTPGAISPATGLLKNSNSTWLNGQPLDRDLAERLGRPIAMANDADCLALSEATDGAAAGAASVFAVILGTGVGGGLAIHGRVLAGPNAIAGEWGHAALPWPRPEEQPGPPCYCGLTGCIETFLSGPGLAHDHRTGVAAARVDRGQDDDLAAVVRQGHALPVLVGQYDVRRLDSRPQDLRREGQLPIAGAWLERGEIEG